jgi:tetratricopeptide (TPR) repeat protein
LSPAALFAQQPIPAAADAPTRKAYQARHLAYRLELLAAYDQFTNDPPAVRRDAHAFLETVERNKYVRLDADEWSVIAAKGVKVLADGSADPLVRTAWMFATRGDRTDDEANAEAWSCYDAMKASRYPESIQIAPLMRLREGWTRSAPAAQGSSTDAVTKIAKAWIADSHAKFEHQRFRWWAIASWFDDLDVAHQKAFVEACLTHPDVDPWLTNLVAGVHYIDEAWDARGSGYANTVAEGQWRQFRGSLTTASQYLRNAWQLNPEHPEPASHMITVAMGIDDPGLTTRDWFDRSVAAEFDHLDAYSRYMQSLRPRWGGSFEAQYAFGRECLATGRFDTDVPYMCIDALKDIDDDVQEEGHFRFLAFEPEAHWRDALAAFTGLIDDPGHAEHGAELRTRAFLQSECMFIAFDTKRYDEARRLADSMVKPIDARPMNEYGRNSRRVLAAVYAHSGPAASQAKEISARIKEGERVTPEDRAVVMPLLDEACRLDPSPDSEMYLAWWKTVLAWEQAFDDGQWVELRVPASGVGWLERSGKWTSDTDGSIKVRPDSRVRAPELLCMASFPDPFEIQVEMFTKSPPQAPRTAEPGVCLGLTWDGDGESSRRAFWVSPFRREVGYDNTIGQTWNASEPLVRMNDWNRFRLRLWGERCDFAVNGHATPLEEVKGLVSEGRLALFCRRVLLERDRVEFKNLRIRKLTRPPPPPFIQYESRVEYYTGVIADDPTDAGAWAYRALGKLNLDQLDEAEADLRHALELLPDNSQFHYYLGLVAKRRFDFDAAIAEFEVAHRCDANNIEPLLTLAWIRSTHPVASYRDGKAAVELCEKARRAHRPNWWGETVHAAALAEAGQTAASAEHAQKALRLAPKDKKAMLKGFVAQCQRGEPERDSKLVAKP